MFSRHDVELSSGLNLSNRESIRCTSPRTPLANTFLIVSASLSQRRLKNVHTPTPAASPAFTISRVSASVRPIGLSTTTGIPAFIAARACLA